MKNGNRIPRILLVPSTLVCLFMYTMAQASYYCTGSWSSGELHNTEGVVVETFGSVDGCKNALLKQTGAFRCMGNWAQGKLLNQAGLELDTFGSIDACDRYIKSNTKGDFFCKGNWAKGEFLNYNNKKLSYIQNLKRSPLSSHPKF